MKKDGRRERPSITVDTGLSVNICLPAPSVFITVVALVEQTTVSDGFHAIEPNAPRGGLTRRVSLLTARMEAGKVADKV